MSEPPGGGVQATGIWQQDLWSNGGARGLVAAATFDSGSTWTSSTVVPGLTRCSGGAYQRVTDPWLSYGSGAVSRVHQLALVFNDADATNALLTSHSDDGGRTWTSPVTVHRDTAPAFFDYKPTITADPSDPNLVYAVWTRAHTPAAQQEDIRRRRGLSLINRAGDFLLDPGFSGPTWFARSTDGGVTYEPARQIFDPGLGNQTIANQIAVLPTGELVDAFTYFDNQLGNNVAVIRSQDRGVTWTRPTIVARINFYGVYDPQSFEVVRTGDVVTDIAVHPRTGELFVVWQDPTLNHGINADAIAMSSSTDRGRTWTAPFKVNATPANVSPLDQQAFTPSVEVTSDGDVAVSYYDFRNNTSATTTPTDAWVVHCHPRITPCRTFGSFGEEARLTAGSFDLRTAPNIGGVTVGDYTGLANGDGGVLALFAQPHGTDRASVFSRQITTPP